MVLDLAVELDAATLELGDRALDVARVERDVVGAPLRRMHPHVALGRVEDEPAVPDVRERELELVFQEGPELVCVRAVEHRVHALDHVRSFTPVSYTHLTLPTSDLV